ncbi:hypothetical protein TSTA_092080 [Talaromyces stipitatus ATCC 10500]|uniref:Ankyrin repeat protein n=1 Tax=Talaromyces stipitatus (strain ATCC 10500 / CBS 375.48 / QM 6759 / NRRL 1006) TaxID=441959 RepID=B8M2Q5_TALSN|nr:uncharacterized protein TSTA_092080 [Talaromyces stipitatus ATCC 10500]EED21966.1 hypothetical protein TSTA_092080 [Talaromyces stipitatus ATCC 10500]
MPHRSSGVNFIHTSLTNARKRDRSAEKKTSVLADSEDDDGWELIWGPTDQEFYFKNHSTGKRRTASPKVALQGRRYLPEVEHPSERQKDEALVAALQAGYSKQVVSQILRYSMNLNVQILEYDQTPDDIEIIPHGRDMVPVTPLEWAMEHERLDLVNLFLDNGADANFTVSSADGPAVFKAAKRKSRKLVEILVQKTSRVSCTRALALVVEQQDITTTTILLAHDNVRCDFEESDRPLPPHHYEWSCGLSDSAHIKSLEAKDMTPPLARAARLGNVALLKLLLEHGADP